jgi:hypothetical protein
VAVCSPSDLRLHQDWLVEVMGLEPTTSTLRT